MTNASGTTTFTASSTVEWSVDDDAALLTATKTDESTISVSYEANASTSSRTANIKAVGTGEVEETVTVTQAAATFDVSPNSRSVTDVSGTTPAPHDFFGQPPARRRLSKEIVGRGSRAADCLDATGDTPAAIATLEQLLAVFPPEATQSDLYVAVTNWLDELKP